jgi:hypothetical protein
MISTSPKGRQRGNRCGKSGRFITIIIGDENERLL